MIRTIFLTAVFVMATPVLGQVGAAPQQPVPSVPQDQGGQAGDGVASIIDSEFPAYDQNHDGQLDKAEFSRWMVALKGQEMKATGKTLAPAEVTAWADGAFTTADTDKSNSVSKPELISYLSDGTG